MSHVVMKPGMHVGYAPINLTDKMKSVEMHQGSLTEALSEDNVGASNVS